MDTESLAIAAIFLPHGIAGAFFAWRLMPKDAKRELKTWFKDEGDGGTPRPQPVRPRRGGGGGEPPLPSATPSTLRLRDVAPGERGASGPRRPVHPARPAPNRKVHEPRR